MSPEQALEYLFEVTVIEPTIADERAEEAVNVLRARLATLECMLKQECPGAGVGQIFWDLTVAQCCDILVYTNQSIIHRKDRTMDKKQKETQEKIAELTWLQARIALSAINEGKSLEEAIAIALSYD